jgi:hypothetical protein
MVMTEIEKVKSEIKVLEAKLSRLKEMENHKMTLKDEGKFYFVHHNDKLYHRMEYTHIPIVWWFENVNTLENPVPMHRKVMDGELNKTLEQLYQEQIAEKETTQERGDRIHKEVEKLLSENENKWKSAALTLGRKFPVILPHSYDELSPEAWLEWATFTYQDEVKKLQEKVDVKTDLKPWEPTTQTPEETEKGLRDAMKQAKKDGVFDKSPLDIIKEWGEKNKPPTLYEILMEWWVNDDWTDQSDESIIDNLVDIIDKKFIPPHSDTNDYQWNRCLKLMRDKLR